MAWWHGGMVASRLQQLVVATQVSHHAQLDLAVVRRQQHAARPRHERTAGGPHQNAPLNTQVTWPGNRKTACRQ